MASRNTRETSAATEKEPLPQTCADWDTLALAHIYPQFMWHHEARIIANPVALRAMAEAMLHAAENGRAVVALMARDGEGYGLEIERTNSAGLDYTRLPYTADFARTNEADYAASLRERIAELEALGPQVSQPIREDQ